MAILLGIDTGGTYTDAVLLDDKRGVISTAKAPTTKHDLSVGIQNAVSKVLSDARPNIQLVSLSSTLATNAIVEGQGSPVCLILIGYDPRIAEEADFQGFLNRKNIVFVDGGHDTSGDERHPLDIAAARKAIRRHAPQVTAFAVSSYFGVRNPEHELRVKREIRRLTNLPVTCGHELTSNLDAPRRALTVAMNARLLDMLAQLILAVSQILTRQGIDAPLMVVRGNGTLMEAKVALERPVETILSGPAASLIGARYLSGTDESIIIDMGGTTTDIGVMHESHPIIDARGAQVGGWRTMVEAVDVQTTGLGGDSEVSRNGSGGLGVGPRRVVPLSLLDRDYPMVSVTLKRHRERYKDADAGCFVLRERKLRPNEDISTPTQKQIWEFLQDGPAAVLDLTDLVGSSTLVKIALFDLIERGLVVSSTFTPTDAVHVLGQYRGGSVAAAELAAELWGRRLKVSGAEFCHRVVDQLVKQAGNILIESILSKETRLSPQERESLVSLLVDRVVGGINSTLAVALSLRRPIVGIGAPAATYLSHLARKLNTELVIPDYAEVANAVGAAAGSVVETVSALVRAMEEDKYYRVYLPSGIRNFLEREEALDYATRAVSRLAKKRAHEAGAATVKVSITENTHIAQVYCHERYIETEILATAVGRPRLKK
jgi:N-methylhydantoinase A/oxoprolinase/acetone carboxylase beta subunit